MASTEVNTPFGAAQGPDLNPVGMLWDDLKTAIHTRQAKNPAEPKTVLSTAMVQDSSWLCRSDLQLQEMFWLRLLLPNKGQPVIKSKDPHTLHPALECSHVVFNKNMKEAASLQENINNRVIFSPRSRIGLLRTGVKPFSLVNPLSDCLGHLEKSLSGEEMLSPSISPVSCQQSSIPESIQHGFASQFWTHPWQTNF